MKTLIISTFIAFILTLIVIFYFDYSLTKQDIFMYVVAASGIFTGLLIGQLLRISDNKFVNILLSAILGTIVFSFLGIQQSDYFSYFATIGMVIGLLTGVVTILSTQIHFRHSKRAH